MEADFSGYATKAGLKCSDGRTIMPDAFKHQDTMTVPLVWQHGHTDPENVLGHAILENREDGVYTYGFFNKSKKAEHARELIAHGDITKLSIWANDLIERAGRVLHGAIREVSLVISGANPGAIIENVTIRHSDGDDPTVLEDEAIIYTGLDFEFGKGVQHAVGGTGNLKGDTSGGSGDGSGNGSGNGSGDGSGNEKTVQDVYDSMNDEQKQVLHYMIGEAMLSAGSGGMMQQDDLGTGTGDGAGDGNGNGNGSTNSDDKKGSGEMKHNVFEDKDKDGKPSAVLSHEDVKGILADAIRGGSLRSAVEEYALSHSIENIDVLFPEVAALEKEPAFLSRRMEWVGSLLGAVRKSPFSRIKTISADITLEDARAKGYVTGALKKEEFFEVTRRVTTPTTIYKKQELDRDDVVDITDFDVVVWLKGEMRSMLEEELARAILIGDGRDVSSADKIPEANIRPIAKEHELFATTVYVNIGDASSSPSEIVDAIISNRKYYKGTGMPTFYTTETVIASFLLLRDTLGRRIYKTVDEIAAELRVAGITTVEAMEDQGDLIGVIVNPVDYVVGATNGGEVNLFDDFDIDYNKQKYLIETRVCGALTRLRSALIVRSATSDHVAVTPNDPTFVESTGVVTIVATTGVVYKNQDTGGTLSTGAQTALDPGETLNVEATAADGYFIPSSADAIWSFTRPSA